MVKSTAAPHSTPPSFKVGDSSAPKFADSAKRSNQFFAMALTMSWQLAVVVLVPVIGGVQLDKAAGTKYVFTFVGLALALVGSGVVMWRALQRANGLPVPKLTDAQRAAIKKSYDDEDNE